MHTFVFAPLDDAVHWTFISCPRSTLIRNSYQALETWRLGIPTDLIWLPKSLLRLRPYHLWNGRWLRQQCWSCKTGPLMGTHGSVNDNFG